MLVIRQYLYLQAVLHFPPVLFSMGSFNSEGDVMLSFFFKKKEKSSELCS